MIRHCHHLCHFRSLATCQTFPYQLWIYQPSALLTFFISTYRFTNLLGWCKSNCGFALLNFPVRYWSTFLNKFGYVIHYFNVRLLLYIFSNDLLLVVYVIFILDYRNNVRQKSKFEQFFYSSSKWVIKQCKSSQYLTTHLDQNY